MDAHTSALLRFPRRSMCPSGRPPPGTPTGPSTPSGPTPASPTLRTRTWRCTASSGTRSRSTSRGGSTTLGASTRAPSASSSTHSSTTSPPQSSPLSPPPAATAPTCRASLRGSESGRASMCLPPSLPQTLLATPSTRPTLFALSRCLPLTCSLSTSRCTTLPTSPRRSSRGLLPLSLATAMTTASRSSTTASRLRGATHSKETSQRASCLATLSM
mmetsp:Transcript_27897/g.64802  ORF Transcript_27897/g.64802 Transcript_27897/m.64802 type:complete len:216 (-) Transcript_27897:650-1297(-)